MQQNDSHNNDLGGLTSGSDQKKAANIEDWRDEHGRPSFKFLQSFADDGSPAALEKLKSIADDLNVSYDTDTPIEELIGKIRSAAKNVSNTTN